MENNIQWVIWAQWVLYGEACERNKRSVYWGDDRLSFSMTMQKSVTVIALTVLNRHEISLKRYYTGFPKKKISLKDKLFGNSLASSYKNISYERINDSLRNVAIGILQVAWPNLD